MSRGPLIGRCGSIFWRANLFHHRLLRVEGAICAPSFWGDDPPRLVPRRALGQAVLLLCREAGAQFVAGRGGPGTTRTLRFFGGRSTDRSSAASDMAFTGRQSGYYDRQDVRPGNRARRCSQQRRSLEA